MDLRQRDDVRRRPHVPLAQAPSTPKASWRPRFVTVVLVVAVAGAATWLLRGSSVIPDSAPRAEPLVVNINTATAAQLVTVPGIGPRLSTQIIAGRPYQSVEELLKLPGMGEQTLQTMKPFLTTDGETRTR